MQKSTPTPTPTPTPTSAQKPRPPSLPPLKPEAERRAALARLLSELGVATRDAWLKMAKKAALAGEIGPQEAPILFASDKSALAAAQCGGAESVRLWDALGVDFGNRPAPTTELAGACLKRLDWVESGYASEPDADKARAMVLAVSAILDPEGPDLPLLDWVQERAMPYKGSEERWERALMSGMFAGHDSWSHWLKIARWQRAADAEESHAPAPGAESAAQGAEPADMAREAQRASEPEWKRESPIVQLSAEKIRESWAADVARASLGSGVSIWSRALNAALAAGGLREAREVLARWDEDEPLAREAERLRWLESHADALKAACREARGDDGARREEMRGVVELLLQRGWRWERSGALESALEAAGPHWGAGASSERIEKGREAQARAAIGFLASCGFSAEREGLRGRLGVAAARSGCAWAVRWAAQNGALFNAPAESGPDAGASAMALAQSHADEFMMPRGESAVLDAVFVAAEREAISGAASAPDAESPQRARRATPRL